MMTLEPSFDFDAWGRNNVAIEKSWAEGVKYLTGESRRPRADNKFNAWVEKLGITESWAQVFYEPLHFHFGVQRTIKDLKARGFTREELEYYDRQFAPLKNSSCSPKKPTVSNKKPKKRAK